MCKLGIVTYNIARDWDLDTILQNCVETGLEGVELRTTHAHGVEPSLSAAARSEIKRKFADTPVTLVGLGSTCEYHSPDPAVLRQNLALTRDFIQLAADVGAGGVKVRPNGFPENIPQDRTLEQIGRAVGEVAAFGADHGVAVRLEVHGRGTCHPPHVRTLIDHADHPNARVCWNSNSQDCDENGSIDAHFALLRDAIDLVHINKLYGPYPYERLFALLHEMHYQGFCLAEIESSDDPQTVLRYYRRLFTCMQPRA